MHTYMCVVFCSVQPAFSEYTIFFTPVSTSPFTHVPMITANIKCAVERDRAGMRKESVKISLA